MVAKFFGVAYCMVGTTGFSRPGGQRRWRDHLESAAWRPRSGQHRVITNLSAIRTALSGCTDAFSRAP